MNRYHRGRLLEQVVKRAGGDLHTVDMALVEMLRTPSRPPIVHVVPRNAGKADRWLLMLSIRQAERKP